MFSPNVLWAQKKDVLFITVEVNEVKNLSVVMEESRVEVSGMQGEKSFKFELKFPKSINTKESKYTQGRNLLFRIVKAEPESWDLFSSSGKPRWLKCDWDKWVDSDDENTFDEANFGNFDLNDGLGGFDEESVSEVDNELYDEAEAATGKEAEDEDAALKMDTEETIPENVTVE